MKRREELDKYHDMSQEELSAETARLKESLFRLKFKLALGEVDAVKRIRQEKRSLARLQTISRQREPRANEVA
jgi:large subunit ribosomal protein L29